MAEAISDDVLVWTLSRYAGLAARLLDDPRSWADDPPASRIGRALRGVRRRLTGSVYPGSAGWADLPFEQRADWWVDRVATIAAPIAATPRFFGLVADRLPLQAAFGAAAQGLAVCAVAREYGRTDPDSWVPLLGRVLLDRDLPSGRAKDALEGSTADDVPVKGNRLRRGGRAIWGLARGLLAIQGLLDHRPRGAWIFRVVGKIPVVGLVAGMLDERGGVRKAARETVALLRDGNGDGAKPGGRPHTSPSLSPEDPTRKSAAPAGRRPDPAEPAHKAQGSFRRATSRRGSMPPTGRRPADRRSPNDAARRGSTGAL